MDLKLQIRALVCGLTLAVVSVACGGGSSPSDSASTDDTNAATQEPQTQETVTQSDDAETPETGSSEEPKSLDEYLGLAANVVRGGGGPGGGGRGGGGVAGGGAGGFDEDQIVEQQRLVQQGIQVCMLEQGFTYVPEEVGDGLQFFLRSSSAGTSPVEYAETQGFGISTAFDAIFEGEFELDETANPNEEHLASLSQGEADAWQFALRGAPPERNEQGQLINPETGEVIQGGRGRATGGCTAEAQEAVRGDLSALAELADEFVELDERIAADPRIAELQREWVDCMRGEGFDYQDEAEARAELNEEFRPLLRSFFQSAAAGGGQGGGGQRGNPLEAVAGLELTAEQEIELGALQDRERAIAIAALECRGDSSTEIDEIAERYEADFVETHREVLESLS